MQAQAPGQALAETRIWPKPQSLDGLNHKTPRLTWQHLAGLSRVLCLPKGEDVHETAICKSYRVAQGEISCRCPRTRLRPCRT